MRKKKDSFYDFYDLNKVKCICGKVANFYTGIECITCSHCGRLIFRNKKCEFNYRIKRRCKNASK